MSTDRSEPTLPNLVCNSAPIFEIEERIAQVGVKVDEVDFKGWSGLHWALIREVADVIPTYQLVPGEFRSTSRCEAAKPMPCACYLKLGLIRLGQTSMARLRSWSGWQENILIWLQLSNPGFS
jgi:hypothetical protein